MARPRRGRPSLRKEVADAIKRHMLDNRMRPGDPLPTEAELCATLSASRSSVREAVNALAALDIVEVRHGHGTYVGTLGLSALAESMTFRGLLSPGDEFRGYADLVDVRELFERGNAERIVGALTPAHLDRLDGLVAEMELRRAGGDAFVATDRAFHALLVEPLGNDLISQLSQAFWDSYAGVGPHLGLITIEDERHTVDVHRRLTDAARAGDAAAFAAAVADHYAPVRRRLAEARSAGTAARHGTSPTVPCRRAARR
ncbi:FadR/GntR family transcriptional regulator [Streptomyces pinistramenti]|uniref:FadR/GntR family transcriptional regulator n=1 Tax=Streptomyces pinistramenti TaxID=2884812 RepID=UPI001D07ABED|nr:FCD domain-containing protein [Streptomyces pinistramenti]MCB5909497.1 GntR family transcriptional regulator [Streptomyces pinistramenti]